MKNNRVILSGVYFAIYYDEIILRLRIFKTFGDPMHFKSENVIELSYSFLLIYELYIFTMSNYSWPNYVKH